MTMIDVVLAGFWILTWILIGTIYFHAVTLSFFGLRKREGTPDHPPEKRFAVLIPAHNEEGVLRPLLEDLRNQDYPKELVDVFVIADNCTDRTSDVAQAVPGVHAFVRSGGAMGKGAALRYALERVLAETGPDGALHYDAVVFFDADNRVSSNFLQKMNTELCEGHRFIQGYLGTKNPFDNWVTRVIYDSYCMTNRLWQLGKRNAGLPSQCGGTGFCVDAKILRDLGWPMTSITEDLEMVCLLAQKSIFPVWCHDAVVYDEKPSSIRVALKQRTRWMRGHFTNTFRYFVPLVRRGIAEQDVRLLDCALYLLYPLAVLSIGMQGILWLLSATVVPNLLVVRPALPILVLILAIVTYYPILGVYLETRSLKELAYLPILLVFNWTWVLACFTAIVTFRDRRWYHTPHSATLDREIQLQAP